MQTDPAQVDALFCHQYYSVTDDTNYTNNTNNTNNTILIANTMLTNFSRAFQAFVVI